MMRVNTLVANALTKKLTAHNKEPAISMDRHPYFFTRMDAIGAVELYGSVIN